MITPDGTVDRTVGRRQHPRDRARRPDHGAGRERLPARAHARAGHRRPVRLRRPAHHGDDRAPQDRPGDRRAALLRLRRSRRRSSPTTGSRPAGELVHERRDRGAGADDDARLRDHRPARRLPRPADDVLSSTGSAGACPTAGTTATAPGSASCRSTGPARCAGSTSTRPTSSTSATRHTDAERPGRARRRPLRARRRRRDVGRPRAERRRARRRRGRHAGLARMHRWVLDPATGTVTETAARRPRRRVPHRRRRARRPGGPLPLRRRPTSRRIVKFDVAGGRGHRARARPRHGGGRGGVRAVRRARPRPRTTAGCSRSPPGATAARRSCSCSTPPTWRARRSPR